MIRELIIDASPDEIRAALLEDGELCEIHRESAARSDQAESIFYGRVQAIKPSINAAFVDIGAEQNAFLPLADDMSLRCGDMILVQVLAKQSTDTKGLRITNKLNLAGKWLVLIPDAHGVHISKKVKDPSLRSALLELGERICPAECGMIVRTASEDLTAHLLEEEAQTLFSLWQSIQSKAHGLTRPGLVYGRLPLHMRLIRDLQSISRIIVNSEQYYRDLLAASASGQIRPDTSLEYYPENAQLIFDAYSIESQIDKALRKRVWLPSGGYLIIDFCEAMTVIDVNSGKMILGKDLEDTALRVNLEAADEIARQIRLRDIGGMIIVDFIDMKSFDNREKLISCVKHAVSADRTQVSVEGITRLGLMEITRKRVHQPLHKALRQSCSYCSGSGEILTADESARRALRQIRRMFLSGQRGPFVVRCAPQVAQALAALHPPRNVQVYAVAVGGKHAERFDIEQSGSGISIPGDARMLQSED